MQPNTPDGKLRGITEDPHIDAAAAPDAPSSLTIEVLTGLAG
jgi:hypothetical protein